jgi:DNA-binding MurR/RpiR family transcriptional regulator
MDLDIQNEYLENVNEESVCIIFSYSGLSQDIIDFYHQIKEQHGKVILLTSNRFSPMYDIQNINLFILKNEEVQKQQRNSLVSILFIIMELVYLLSN